MAGKKKQARKRPQKAQKSAKSAPEAPSLGQVIHLFDDDESRPRLSPIDEMNIVETPFSLLAQRNTSIQRIDLSPTGDRYLAANGKSLLPTALAEQVVLGLLWMHRERDGFKHRKIRFRLRDLVTKYIHPERYATVRPPGPLLKTVREQLHRVAATRLYTEKWYDKRLGRHTPMDAAIIDYIQVIQEGGKNRPEIIEVGWGEKFFDSIRAKYTKDLDPMVYLQIDKPLDRRLFRWLDRQLHQKVSQEVSSIQTFARSKLGMTGTVLERGGRSASSYVSSRLSKAITRLTGVGFPVRMEVDTSVDDYRLTFYRLDDGRENEVAEVDDAGDLLRHFTCVMHGGTGERKRRAFRAADRAEAGRWVEAYGLEASMWMVEEAKRVQGRLKREPVLAFTGLGLYEQSVVGAWERRSAKEKGQVELKLPPAAPSWEAYMAALLAGQADADTDEKLRSELEAELSKERGWKMMGSEVRAKWVASELPARRATHYQLIERDAYQALSADPPALEDELQRRHGIGLGELEAMIAIS